MSHDLRFCLRLQHKWSKNSFKFRVRFWKTPYNSNSKFHLFYNLQQHTLNPVACVDPFSRNQFMKDSNYQSPTLAWRHLCLIPFTEPFEGLHLCTTQFNPLHFNEVNDLFIALTAICSFIIHSLLLLPRLICAIVLSYFQLTFR